jgi:hypothetical protein
MLHPVPLFPLSNILDAKIGRKVNHRTPASTGQGLLHCNAVRRCKKHHITGGQICTSAGLQSKDQPGHASLGTYRDRRPGSPRDVMATISVRVLRQQAQQLDTGISGAPTIPTLIMLESPQTK